MLFMYTRREPVSNHRIAVVKDCEDYETISKAFAIGRTFKNFATPYLLKCQPFPYLSAGVKVYHFSEETTSIWHHIS
ncbi:hypothetical protein EMCRGX_G022059 [Ephydatia muelleri]